jgi:retinol dehydrogenase-12
LKKNNPEYLKQRYPTSKLLEVFGVRALAAEMSSGPHSSQKVILNTLNPGFCHSELSRNTSGLVWLQLYLMKIFVARSTEAGSRALFASTIAGEESHGKYLSDCVVSEPSDFVRSEEGKSTEVRVYEELKGILEGIQPGITKNI